MNFRRIVRWKNEMSSVSQLPAALGRRAMNKLSSAATLVGIHPPPARADLRSQAVRDQRRHDRSDGRRPDRTRSTRTRAGTQAGHHRRPDGRRDLQHRFRAGRGRRAAGEPHARRHALSRKTRFLPRGPGHLLLRRPAGPAARRRRRRRGRLGHAEPHGRPRRVLQPPHRALERRDRADRCRRTRHGQSRPVQHGPARHPHGRRGHDRRPADEFFRRAREARRPAAERRRDAVHRTVDRRIRREWQPGLRRGRRVRASIRT